MTASHEPVKILTVASCSNVRDEHRGHVVVSGSYGGRYNAYNAAKWPARAVIMNDAGIGKDDAGIVGLAFLDRIEMAAATADAQSSDARCQAQDVGRAEQQRTADALGELARLLGHLEQPGQHLAERGRCPGSDQPARCRER